MNKNTKKVLNKIYSQNKKFKPSNNPVSWNKAVKYIKAKDARLTYNLTFKPLYDTVKKEMRDEGTHKSVLKRRAKAKVKELIKAKFALATAAQQVGAEQEKV